MRTINILTLIMLIFTLSATGCIDNGGSASGDDRIIVAVSILPQQEFVEKIAGDNVETILMIPPGASPATYEPSPGQLRELTKARAFFIVGSGLPFEEVWLGKIEGINKDMLIVDCSKGINIIGTETEENTHLKNIDENFQEDGDHAHEGSDPHIWTSPINAKMMVENTYLGLIEIDPENKDIYLNNKENYLKELDDADAMIREKLMEGEERSFMTYHPSWGYFAAEYGLDMITIENEGKEPSPQDMQRVIDKAKEKNIRTIFVQAQFSKQSAETIASAIDGKVVVVDPLAKDYVGNLEIITEAFSEGMTT
ncbi:metal ABC transporter solute-binding protein, Zn/Mn family [Methanococcoides burtonii]|uniref:Zinc ABC transporter solute binding protein n=1 Tax=Methanococcoides burtonii (strain DSM 6242 / NBRC 107633 / OCM 468 / ACE-M) TaxID=259564 RepID=Q12X72_METBU|nr:zinc ABC transporter substrate-binding protein [Methanococcoides burtonii]ABE51954.1 Zinc ABC transporter solute binding protein [Methanococcoides burtonii DSM 6242]